jgi:hypothetical protein
MIVADILSADDADYFFENYELYEKTKQTKRV